MAMARMMSMIAIMKTKASNFFSVVMSSTPNTEMGMRAVMGLMG